ncbi:hypothetical protein P4E94_19060 [Pontiellaceae bacterium B12219]|nr:hypothetical protein [Pontiellaceae bacterium B12219]
MKLECDTLKLTGYDALTGTDYVSALTTDVSRFTAATFNLYAYVGSTRYTCTSGVLYNTSDDYCYLQLVEGGQYVQRFNHEGLVFTASDGSVLVGRLEITAWPEHAVFKLDMSDETGVTRTTVQLINGAGTELIKDTMDDTAILAVIPQSQTLYGSKTVSSYITSAKESDGTSLTTSYDTDEAAFKISVPPSSLSYPSDKNLVDEYVITVKNPTSSTMDVPLIFDQTSLPAITGTMMMLCDDSDGSPLGIPVQISKNWHTGYPTTHSGYWLRGYSMIPLAAGESQTIRLRVVYGYYGNGTFGAATHSQLSLVGWNNGKAPWKWDESALGCWGEALTYDPSRHAGHSMLCDIRPSFTTSLSGGSYNWTENVGGGDFLVYYDSSSTFRYTKKLKTCYKWAGPNMTEVLYTGVTDDDKIRFTYTVRGNGTLDYQRKFHKYRYEFLDNVTSPERLVFYQMAADENGSPDFDNYYRGSADGLMKTYAASPGGDVYKETMLFSSRWLSIEDTETSDGNTTMANRGLLHLSSTLNGSPLNTYIHACGIDWHDMMLFDFSAQSVSSSYSAGDVVEGEIEFILPAKNKANYWGDDSEFESRLGTYGNSWNAVYDEYRYNRDMSVTMNTGTLTENYPLEITAADGTVLADFTINGGGIGHVPVMLNNVPADAKISNVQRYVNGSWSSLETVSISDHDYFQGYYNAGGSMDYAFSLKRPSTNLSESWRIRILGSSSSSFPDPNKTYYIDCPKWNKRVAATGSSEDAYTTSTSTTGDDVEWKFVDKGNGYWHIDRAAGGTKPRLRSDNSSDADMQETSSTGSYTYWDFTESSTAGRYLFTLPDGPSSYCRLQMDSSGNMKMVTTAYSGSWTQFTFTEAD